MASKLSTYRNIGAPGQPWPLWCRNLRGKSGVYCIKDNDDGAVLYVGESHTGRLYQTLTRHFQKWSNAHQTAGKGYHRQHCTVAVKTTRPGQAVDEQNRQIERINPIDNDIRSEADSVPF